MTAYYNEFDPYAAQWLRNLISAGHIAPGEVDERSILEVSADDLLGFTQCHFFAGIGGWSLGARMAGWPDHKPLWTGSCPCQPFSVAGSQKGQADERHLWPVFFALISARRPDVVMGEQVAAAVGKDWLDGVHSDLESIGYACGAAVVPACAVDAPHRRDRLWFVAAAKSRRLGADGRTQEARRLGGFGYSDFSGTGARGALANTSGNDERRNRQSGSSGRPQIEAGRLCDAGDVANANRGTGPEHVNEPWRRPTSAAADTAEHPSNSDVDDAIEPRLERQSRDGDDCGQPGRLDPVETGSVAAASSALPDTSKERCDSGCASGGQEEGTGSRAFGRNSTAWVGSQWLIGADGKARRVEPGIRLLAHGVPARVGKLRAYGNAIVPEVAEAIAGAYLDVERSAA